uniref:Uncharacterized protein n=1 Tax=uncultured organism TaxID=155900 RepID=Q0GNL1_9ZZZZ|nr:hypothetical protein [uncultured organism]
MPNTKKKKKKRQVNLNDNDANLIREGLVSDAHKAKKKYQVSILISFFD